MELKFYLFLINLLIIIEKLRKIIKNRAYSRNIIYSFKIIKFKSELNHFIANE